MESGYGHFELLSRVVKVLAFSLKVLRALLVFNRAIRNHLLILFNFLPTLLLVFIEFLLSHNSLHLFDMSGSLLVERRVTLAA